MHSPSPKITNAMPNTSAADTPSAQRPPPKTIIQATAHSRVINASAGIRRLPSSTFTNGSCAMTIASVLAKKINPICRSEMPDSFLAKTGNTSSCA